MSDFPDVATFLIKGDDTSLVSEALQRLVTELLGEIDRAVAVEDLDAQINTADEIADACQTPAFLTPVRIVIARNIGSLSTTAAAPVVSWIKEPLESTKLICIVGGGQISRSVSDAIRKNGHIVDTAVPTGKARSTWFANEFKYLPVEFEPAARNALMDHLGDDVSRLYGIADAVAAANGTQAKISLDQLEPYLGEEGDVAPWELTDAIDRGDSDSALHQLHRMTRAGERHPLVIMATLYKHYRNALTLDGAHVSSEHEAAQLLGISPYPAKKAIGLSGKLGHKGITRAISLLAAADLDLRGDSALDPEIVMEVLVARLCYLSPARRRQPASAR